MTDRIIEMTGIHKSYGSNEVLHGVDFHLVPGEIRALLGENGTGKSTLMNVLAGVIPGNAGTIVINGTESKLNNSFVSPSSDIGFIHQELALINDLNIFENLFIGKELKNGIKLNKKSMAAKAKEVLDSMDVDLDPWTMVGDLNASYKQVVEIARALMMEAKVIIMDEPTTALTNVEIEHVFNIMRRLKAKGVSFVFISHKLNEVLEICDSYTVMRDGLVVSEGPVTPELTEDMIAKHMVGKDLTYDDIYSQREIGEEILSLHNLTKEREYTDINMNVRKGEIVGITGLLGDGRYELMSSVYGYNPGYEGEIRINGEPCEMNSIQKAISHKISYLPRNRKENGIIPDFSIKENVVIYIMKFMKRLRVFIDHSKEREVVTDYIDKLRIKLGEMGDNITSLSGGNQQKVILAKVLSSGPDLVILDNPTQGVDVGAKLEIYRIIQDLAKAGVSFVVLTSEAQEVLMLCDRIYVMFHGEMRREFSRTEANEEDIMTAATGGRV